MAALPRLLRHITVTMRDGVRLATTVHLPPGQGPFPAVLVRTAYNRVPMTGDEFVQRGMAFVAQDVRGRYGSGGEYYPFTAEEDDGSDTLQWLAAQPWCDGRVGMFGDSYLAATQFYAALSGSPHLAALNPRFMAGDCWKRAYYADGAFSLGLTWSWLCFECNARASEAGFMPRFDVGEVLRSLPIVDMDIASGAGVVRHFRDYVESTRYGAQWEPLNVRARFQQVRTPMFLVGGWYDYYAGETFANYAALLQHTDPALAHRVLVGPWTHGISGASALGELDFGPAALAENDCTLRWLTATLTEQTDQFPAAPIRLFVMGENVWRDEWEWPLARTRWTDYHLRAGGGLTVEAHGDEPPDTYTYDPADPAPTRGGNHSIGPYNPGLFELAPPGPFDQRPVEARPDVLTYTSEVLERDLEVTGPVTFTLHAASSAPDTDFVARLCDVYPDGRSINITEGVIRARFREGIWGVPRLMEPGRVYEFTVDLACTSNVFRAGHRLRLDLTSSCFPLWDRNLNTGGDPATGVEMAVAHQTILHDAAHPSRLHLPVIPR
jgi:uncharacterized protein